MTTQTEILTAADPDGLIDDIDKVLDGMINESLMLVQPFQPHMANLKAAFSAAAEKLIPQGDNISEERRRELGWFLHEILWHSLAPIHSNIFDGRETDAFGLSGTLQRCLGNFKEAGFQQLAERIIDLAQPVRMCEGNFELEAVVPATVKAWTQDLSEAGYLDERDTNALDGATALVHEALEAASPYLIKAITDGIALAR